MAGSKKRKKLVDESGTTKKIRTVFKPIGKDEYEESLINQSSQVSEPAFSSQPTTQGSTASTSTSVPSSQLLPPAPSTTSASMPPNDSMVHIRQRNILRNEAHFTEAHNRAATLLPEIDVASPRQLISCLGVLLINHLKACSYSTEGVFRAIAMEHNHINPVAVGEAWRIAEEGRSYDTDGISCQHGKSSGDDYGAWEAWITDQEALDLLETPLEGIEFDQMQTILVFTYKIACRLSAQVALDPHFTILICGMRQLARKKYDLQRTIKAMAMELAGRGKDAVDGAWEAAAVSKA